MTETQLPPENTTNMVGGSVAETPAPTETPKAPDPKEEKLASRFAELSKRERRLQQEQTRIKEEEKKYSQYMELREKAKNNPFQYMEELTGEKFDDLLSKFVGLDNPDDPNIKVKQLENKIEELSKAQLKKLEEEKAAKEEQVKQQQTQAWQNHMQAVANYVESNADKYQVILTHENRALQIYQDLLQQASAYNDHAGLTDDEVIAIIDRTEEVMTEESKTLYQKLNKINKFKTEPENSQTEIGSLKTLTNQLTSAPTSAKSKRMTDAERLAQIKAKYG